MTISKGKSVRTLLMAASAIVMMSGPAFAACQDRISQIEEKLGDMTLASEQEDKLQDQLSDARDAMNQNNESECMQHVSNIDRELNRLENQQASAQDQGTTDQFAGTMGETQDQTDTLSQTSDMDADMDTGTTTGQATTDSWTGTDDQTTMGQTADASSVTVGDLKGRDVVNINGENLGEIDNIVRSSARSDAYAVVSMGGFLGMGEEKVVVPLSELTFQEDQAIITATDRAELRQNPAYQANAYQPVEEQTTLSELKQPSN